MASLSSRPGPVARAAPRPARRAYPAFTLEPHKPEGVLGTKDLPLPSRRSTRRPAAAAEHPTSAAPAPPAAAEPAVPFEFAALQVQGVPQLPAYAARLQALGGFGQLGAPAGAAARAAAERGVPLVRRAVAGLCCNQGLLCHSFPEPTPGP